MRILILGTSAAEGWPGLFCDCESCLRARELGGKNIRSRTGLLIDNDVKVDLGPDTLCQLHAAGRNLAGVRHLLVTHTHADHYRPLDLRYRPPVFAHWPGGETPVLYIHGNENVQPIAERHLGDDLAECAVAFHHATLGDRFDLGSKTATVLRANHNPKEECLNYLISDHSGTHLHACDTGWYPDETWRLLEGVTLNSVTMECCNGPLGDAYEGHLSIGGLLRMRGRLDEIGCLTPNTRFVAVHFSHNTGLTHEQYESRLCPHGVQVGYDGMVIESEPQTL